MRTNPVRNACTIQSTNDTTATNRGIHFCFNEKHNAFSYTLIKARMFLRLCITENRSTKARNNCQSNYQTKCNRPRHIRQQLLCNTGCKYHRDKYTNRCKCRCHNCSGNLICTHNRSTCRWNSLVADR